MTEEPDRWTPSRRSVLKAGGTLAALSLSGCFAEDEPEPTVTPPTPNETEWQLPDEETPPPNPRENIPQRFDVPFDVKNVAVVEPASQGTKRLTADVFDRADGTIVYLAQGRYQFAEHVRTENLSNVALVGEGAVIEPANPSKATNGYLLTLGGKNFSLEGITFDFTKKNFGGRIQCIATGDFVFRNVTVKGVNHGSGTFRFDVRNPNGSGLVENLVAADGGQTFGILVGIPHEGTLTFRNCHVANFYNNGLYGSAPAKDQGGGGKVRVEGGVYRNNNIAQVRLGGLGSYVRGATIRVDGPVRPRERDGAVNSRGIRLDEAGGARIENCDILLSKGRGLGAIVFSGTAGASTIKDTRIRVMTDGYEAAVNLRSSKNVAPGSQLRNLDIGGSASGITGIRLVDRDRTVLSGVTIKQTGANTVGLHLIRSRDVVVESSTFEVTGRPIRLEQATIDKRNVTEL